MTIPNRGNGMENVEILSLVVSNDWKVCIKWKWAPPFYIYIYIYMYMSLIFAWEMSYELMITIELGYILLYVF